jgi:phage regulator Rha-like protein
LEWTVELVKFNELEDKIKILIDGYSELKRANQELEGLLKKKDEELVEAVGIIKQLNEERDAIRAKVDSLLGIVKNINVPE